MHVYQHEFTLIAPKRGFHLVTPQIIEALPEIQKIKIGTLHLFIQHTSASLSINENCDISVRDDMESFFNHSVDSHNPIFTHTYEGDDDMPAHIKSSLLGASLNIPITQGRLNIGTWQGIYLGEHRHTPNHRNIVATIMGI